jgi:crotonobetainyl-CoA:carnitine CoA-transferase CaiB-like acyl-CoA transferase
VSAPGDAKIKNEITSAPLAGFRIISLAEQYPGPLATMLLADLGAEVILVERPVDGDPSRRFEGHFEALNRNKKSVAINLKSKEGRNAFLRLIDGSDALIEGFRPGVMERLNLGQETLRERQPELVFVSVSSFGQTGPRSTVAGHDLSIQGAAALIDDPPNGEMLPPRMALADIASGMFSSLGIVVALLARVTSGKGAFVDVSMYDSVVCWMAPFLVPEMNGLTPAPLPPSDPGYGVFKCANNQRVTISIAGEDHMWKELCLLLGLEQFSMLTEKERIARRNEISPPLRKALSVHSLEWISTRLEERKIAFGPILKLSDIPEDPQIIARQMIAKVISDTGATRRYVRQPLLFDGHLSQIMSAAPRLGEHTIEILTALGYSIEEQETLFATGAVYKG